MKTIFEIARMVEAAIKPNPRDSFIEAGSKRQLMSECQKLIDVEEKYLNAKNVLYNEELSQYLDMDTARSIFYIIDIMDNIGFDIHQDKQSLLNLCKKHNVDFYLNKLLLEQNKQEYSLSNFRIMTIECDEHLLQKNKFNPIVQAVEAIRKAHTSSNFAKTLYTEGA